MFISFLPKQMEIKGIFPNGDQDEIQIIPELKLPVKSFNDFEFVYNLTYQELNTNPILDIAARVWEEERYEAAKVCYRSMRIIDNLVDHRKTEGDVSEKEKLQIKVDIEDWVEGITQSKPRDSQQKELLETINRFQIPLWPWKRFAKAMIYDIYNDGYKTFDDFLSYSEGAAISPGSIYMHLIGVVKDNGSYRLSQFDIGDIARPVALYAYLVHIIRDFQKDQENNLNYFARDIMAEFGLNSLMLKDIAVGGEINSGFRKLMGRYKEYADYYRKKALHYIEMALPHLESRYMLSLGIIYDLYLQIFERIDPVKGIFTTSELNPTPDEIKERLDQIIY